MKRRLQKIYFLGIAATLAMSLIAVSLMVALKISDTRKDMQSILEIATKWTLQSSEDLQSMAESIAEASPWLRATFVMDHGLVLADSHHGQAARDDHARRPEIIEALEDGTGDSLRISQTESTFVLYVAGRVAPGLILRLSCPIEEITRLIVIYAVNLLILFLLVYTLQRRALSRFQREMLRQMEDVERLLDGEISSAKAVFPDFQPAMDRIAYQAKRLNDDLKEVSRTLNLRNDFVANASHELRSPLTSVMGFAEMLDEGLADTPEEQRLCTGMIRSECGRMLEVIEDILQLSRAEKTQLENRQDVDAAAVAGEVVRSLAPRAAQKGISLRVSGEMTVSATEKAVWEMLYNLTDNAIHYGKPGGYVHILLGGGEIAVEDDGIGVEDKHIAHLTEQFYRVDEARSMAKGGSGLGLSIVSALAAQCGAQLRIQSTFGEGSRFTIDFAPDGKEADA